VESNPSSLLLSNNKFICRPGATAGNLRDCIAFLRNDYGIVTGVCGVRRTNQQPFQLDECGQIDARRAHGHRGANQGIEHPTGNRNHIAGRPLYLNKLTRRSLLHSAYRDLTAKIRVPPVVDFQLLPDMDRVNG
jgi:hypothetical protein